MSIYLTMDSVKGNDEKGAGYGAGCKAQEAGINMRGRIYPWIKCVIPTPNSVYCLTQSRRQLIRHA
jgi:hypothetical protein